MSYFILIWSLQWKKLIRTGFFKEGWGIKLLMGFLGLYFAASFLLLGLVLPDILGDTLVAQGYSMPRALSALLLIYVLAELVARYFLQKLQAADIRHFLLTPLPKARLVDFLLLRSAGTFFNVFPLLIFVPFWIQVVDLEWEGLNGILALVNFLGLTLVLHYLIVYIKRVEVLNAKAFWIFAAVVVGYIGLWVTGWINGLRVSETIFGLSLENPVVGLWQPLLALGLYGLNRHLLLNNSYEQSLNPSKQETAKAINLDALENRGQAGVLLAQEVRLIWRHKRTRSVASLTFLFLLYGLLIYNDERYAESIWMYLLVGIFTTGIFAINYGQFLMNWEAAYMDGLMTKPFVLREYFKSKYFLLAGSTIVLYVLSTPYVYFGWEVLAVNTAAFLFNLGFTSSMLIYAATYNKKRIELNKAAFFNYQGTGAVQFVIILPIMAFPMLVFLPFWALQIPWWGIGAIGAIGTISFLLRPVWYKAMEQNFVEKKYRNLEGFRQKN